MKRIMMNILLAALCVVGAKAWAMDAKDPAALFSGAVKAYHAAKYAEAVALNEAVLAEGVYSAALYYNLGNAWFKLGRPGKALVNYRRAMRLAPRDSDLRANVSFARSMVENYTPWPRGSVFTFTQRFLSVRELQWLAFGAFALAGAFVLVGLFAGFARKRIFTGTLLLACAAGYLITASILQAVGRTEEAVCIERAEARFEPSDKATTHFKVADGAEVRILRKKEGWLKIERSDGKIGWVPAAVVERI
jgi:tetratricopeptide (TPR) repeat protein